MGNKILRWRVTKLTICMTFASSCIFLAKGIRADRVAVCSLLAYRKASNIANFSNTVIAIAELRACSVKTKHDRL